MRVPNPNLFSTGASHVRDARLVPLLDPFSCSISLSSFCLHSPWTACERKANAHLRRGLGTGLHADFASAAHADRLPGRRTEYPVSVCESERRGAQRVGSH